jgi:phosphatidylglycerol:prolipoprotein diacylglycerol transferase
MLPEVFLQIGPFSVYTFGLFLAIVFLLAVFLFWRSAVKEGFSSDPIFDLIFLTALAMLVGGRLSFVIFDSDLSLLKDDPLAFFRFGEGVLWAPALLAGVVTFSAYVRRFSKRGWSFFKLSDLASPVLALGQALIYLTADFCGYFTYSGFLEVERALALVGVAFFALYALLLVMRRSLKRSGATTAVYLIGGGLLTIFAEFLRSDPTVLGGAALNYLLGVVFLLGGVFAAAYLTLFKRKSFASGFGRKVKTTFLRKGVEKQMGFKLNIGRKNSSLRRGGESKKRA